MTRLTALTAGISATKSVLLVSIVSFFFILTFISVLNYLPQVISNTNSLHLMQALQYLEIALALIIGTRFFNLANRITAVFANLSAISIESVLFIMVPFELFRLAIIFIMTAQFSLVLLGLFAWFWRNTEPEERGRVAGFVGFVTLPSYFFTAEILLTNLDLVFVTIFGAILSLAVAITLRFAPMRNLAIQKSDANYLKKRTVLLYVIPWLLFSLVNATLASSISKNISAMVAPSFYLFLVASQVIGATLGALIGGFVADIFGRRPSLMLSLTLYGISSALIGLFQNNIFLLFSYAANGLSWGILFILYVFVVWGDLATEKTVGKMYSIGLAIYYSALGIGLLISPFSATPLISITLASCLLLFFLNVPVILADELLSSETRERMRLKVHMSKVKKIGEQTKNQG
jgi:hypothetical protein